jgi:hypothetical protein
MLSGFRPGCDTFQYGWLPRLYEVVSQLMRGERVATRWTKPPFMFLPASDSSRSPLHEEDFLAYVSDFVAPEILAVMKTGRFEHLGSE